MIDKQTLDLLEALNEVKLHDQFELYLSKPQPGPFLDGIDSRDTDSLLQEVLSLHLIKGKRWEGSGVVHWLHLELTVSGLRYLGEYPPEDGEFLPGPWDSKLWGTVDKPRLLEIAEEKPQHLIGLHLSSSDEERMRWRSITRLYEAGLLSGSSGQISSEGMANPRITKRGEKAITDQPTSPFDRARVHASRAAKSDAINAAIEEGLKPHLEETAQQKQVPLTNQKGKRLSLSEVNDRLKKIGVYSQSQWREVQVCLDIRNDLDHGRQAQVTDDQINRAIDAAEYLCDHILDKP